MSLASVTIMSRYHHKSPFNPLAAQHINTKLIPEKNILNIWPFSSDSPLLWSLCSVGIYFKIQRVGRWLWTKQITFTVKLSKSNPAINLRFHTFLPHTPHFINCLYHFQRCEVWKWKTMPTIFGSWKFLIKTSPRAMNVTECILTGRRTLLLH